MSQFASLFKTDDKTKTEKKSKPVTAKKKVAADPLPPIQKSIAVTEKKIEKRTTGKSSNPDYTQMLTYIKKETHNQIKAALIFDESKRDFSDLVEELLTGWLKNKK